MTEPYASHDASEIEPAEHAGMQHYIAIKCAGIRHVCELACLAHKCACCESTALRLGVLCSLIYSMPDACARSLKP